MSLRSEALKKKLSSKSRSITTLGDLSNKANIKKRLVTSIPELNQILGGGFPFGRVVEIFGQEATGKSSLIADIIHNAQKMDADVILFDSEAATDSNRCKVFKVNIDDVLYSDETIVENIFEVIEELLKSEDSNRPQIIIIDSVAYCLSKKEANAANDKGDYGSRAKAVELGLRKIQQFITENSLIFLVNQSREKMNAFTFIPKQESIGGSLIKFACTIRLFLKNIGKIKSGEDVTGIKIRATTVKNKSEIPYQKAEYCLDFKKGFTQDFNIVEKLLESDHVIKKGIWLKFSDSLQKRFNLPEKVKGTKQLIELFNEDSELSEKIKTYIEKGE